MRTLNRSQLASSDHAVQVGVVSVGQHFPFWVRQQAPILLCVSAAEPGPVAYLGRGAEVSVAPRPRANPAVQRPVTSLPGRPVTAANSPVTAVNSSPAGYGPLIWLRVKVQACRIFQLRLYLGPQTSVWFQHWICNIPDLYPCQGDPERSAHHRRLRRSQAWHRRPPQSSCHLPCVG